MFKLSRKTVKQTDSGENFSPPPLSDFQRQSSTSNQSVVRFSKRLDLKLFSQVCGASLPSAGNIFFSDIVTSLLSCWPTWKKPQDCLFEGALITVEFDHDVDCERVGTGFLFKGDLLTGRRCWCYDGCLIKKEMAVSNYWWLLHCLRVQVYLAQDVKHGFVALKTVDSQRIGVVSCPF